MGTMRGVREVPAGLRYLPRFLGATEEERPLDELRHLRYGEVRCTARAR